MTSKADQLYEEIEKHVVATDLKLADVVVIRNEPCKIVAVSKNKTGKHGCARVTVTALHFFSQAKNQIAYPGSSRVPILFPIKTKYQIIDLQLENPFYNLQLVDDLENVIEFRVSISDNLVDLLKSKWEKFMQDDISVYVFISTSCGYNVLSF